MNLFESIKSNLKESVENTEDFRRNFSSNLINYINKALSFSANNKKEDLEKLDDIISSFKNEIDMINNDFIEYINTNLNESEEFNEAVYLGIHQPLTEKVNHANDDINEKIRKALRSKGWAKRYADEFKNLGITVDDSPSEGVILIGPNGRRLSADRLDIMGPSKPGHNETHGGRYNSIKSHVRDLNNYDKRIAEQKDKIAELKNTERDDIIRKYPDKSTEEALAAHEKSIDKEENSLAYNKNWRRKTQEDIANEHRRRATGHNSNVDYGQRTINRKSDSADKIDYKGYLDSKDNDVNKDFDNRSYGGRGYYKQTPGQKVRNEFRNAKNDVENTYYRWNAEDDLQDKKIDAKAIEARKKAIEEEYKKKMDDEVNSMLERKSKADASYKEHKDRYNKNVKALNDFRKAHNLPTKDEQSFEDYAERKAAGNRRY